MNTNVIHIYGASGSGTTTLANYIASQLSIHVIDTDDYFWLPTNPPYTQKRPVQDRLDLMLADIRKWKHVVISGSLVGWGDSLIPLFTLAVRLVTDTDIRMARIKEREAKHFGNRIQPGGDMYQTHMDFLAWAAAYDLGDAHTRSKAMHDAWQKKLSCKQITLTGNDEPAYNFEKIKPYLL